MAAAAKLIEEGKLDLDKSVRHYVPVSKLSYVVTLLGRVTIFDIISAIERLFAA